MVLLYIQSSSPRTPRHSATAQPAYYAQSIVAASDTLDVTPYRGPWAADAAGLVSSPSSSPVRPSRLSAVVIRIFVTPAVRRIGKYDY